MAVKEKQINAAYDVARDVFDRRLGRVEGQRRLEADEGLNRSTANDYLGAFIDMRKGKRFTRTINALGTKIFLRRIREDYGVAALATALSACREHADYYEALGRGRLQSFRQVCDEVEAESPILKLSEEKRLSQLEQDVQRALQDNRSDRLERLKNSQRYPDQIVTQRNEYARNADVIAEVLDRARGVCEYCQAPAPFLRRDGRPYLEVHHRIPLAEAGEDTVDNAIALCPNCHREAHYGENWESFRS